MASRRGFGRCAAMLVLLLFVAAACAGNATTNVSGQGTGNNESAAQTDRTEETADLEAAVPSQNADYGADTEDSAGTQAYAVPNVYFTNEISPESLLRVYRMTHWEPTGSVAVKVSTGESQSSNYLRPELIGDLVQSVDGTIVECNTAYGGNRSDTEDHLKLAEEHGFTQIAPVVIQDADGSLSIPVAGGTHLQEDLVGAAFDDYDSYLILSHFKGHAMAGYGGAIKNMSIGLASADGKALIHSGGTSTTDAWGGEQDAFLESMAEAAKGVADYQQDRIVYVNVMNRLSVDCDCDASPAEPDMHDIGILASTDPVALDQACVDLIYGAEDGGSVVERIESRNGLHTLEHAEKIGLGSRSYQLVEV